MPSRVLSILTAVLVALGAAACGSDDGDAGGREGSGREEYLTAINEAQREFAAATSSSKLDLATPESTEAFARSLRRFVVELDGLARRFRRIDPPSSVAAEHREFTSHLRRYGRTLSRERGRLLSTDPAEVTDAQTKIDRASDAFSDDVIDTTNRINRRLRQ